MATQPWNELWWIGWFDLPVHGKRIRWNWRRRRCGYTCTGSFSEAMCRKCGGRAKQKASNSSNNNNNKNQEEVKEEVEEEEEIEGKFRGNRSWPLNGITVACHRDEWIFNDPLRFTRIRNKRTRTKTPQLKDARSTVIISIRAEAFLFLQWHLITSLKTRTCK